MKKVIVLLLFAFFFSTSVYADTAQIAEAYGKIPLAFTLNQGQLDTQVKFYTRGKDADIFFTSEAVTFLFTREKESALKSSGNMNGKIIAEEVPAESGFESFAIKQTFLNSNPNCTVAGEAQLPWNNNYFTSQDQTKWRTDVPNYEKVRMENLYAGIDLLYYGFQNSIKYDLIVNPGVNPSSIIIKYDSGGEGVLSINSAKELLMTTPLGTVTQRRPYCYQIELIAKVQELSWKFLERAAIIRLRGAFAFGGRRSQADRHAKTPSGCVSPTSFLKNVW